MCPQSFADHATVVYDDITLRLVRNALDPSTAQSPACHLVLPLLNTRLNWLLDPIVPQPAS